MIRTRTLYLILSLAVVGFLLWVVLRGCNPAPVHKVDKKQVDSAALLAKQQATFNKNMDSLAKANLNLQEQLAAKNRAIAIRSEQLRSSEETISELIRSYEVNRKQDSIQQALANCDSLAQQAFEQSKMIGVFRAQVVDLKALHQQDMANSEARISALLKLNGEMKTSIAFIQQKYSGIDKDYTKLRRRNKRERFLNRALAGAVMVLGGMLILKN